MADTEPKTTLSMRDVNAQLKERGVDISYDSLSTLIGTDDIAAQLGVGGSQARREFAPGVVDILAEFWPIYKAANGRLPQAANMLRNFLSRRLIVPGSSGENALMVIDNPAPAARAEISPMVLAEAQGRAQGLAASDVVLTAQEAAEFLRVGIRTLRKAVPASFRIGQAPTGDRWRRSDLLQLGKPN